MNQKLVIVVNNSPEVEYDRSVKLDEEQARSLDMMDNKMDTGIPIDDQMVNQPDVKQRAHFVASQLFQALSDDNASAIASLTAYLATRLPEARQVRITQKEGGVEIDINYSDIDASATPVTMPGRLN